MRLYYNEKVSKSIVALIRSSEKYGVKVDTRLLNEDNDTCPRCHEEFKTSGRVIRNVGGLGVFFPDNHSQINLDELELNTGENTGFAYALCKQCTGEIREIRRLRLKKDEKEEQLESFILSRLHNN